MMTLLNHADDFKNITNTEYDVNNDINNTNDKISELSTKDSVSLKRCISHNNSNNYKIKNINNKQNNNIPLNDQLNDKAFQEEINIALKKEKAELEEFYKNMWIKLNEDYKRRDEEIRLHILGMNSHIKYLEQKKKNLENFNYALNTNYMDFKYDIDLNNKNISEEIESTKNKNNFLIKGLNESKKKAKLENDLNKKEYNKRSNQVASTLRHQIKTNKETSALAEKQFNIINKIYQQKINSFKNKYDIVEAKYKILQEKIFQNNENVGMGGGGKNTLNEFENIMRGFRERMKQHEEYIVGIKQMAEGDYDHYEALRQITQDKNQKFFDDVNETEMNLILFMEEIMKAKNHYEKMIIPYINNIVKGEENTSEENEENNLN